MTDINKPVIANLQASQSGQKAIDLLATTGLSRQRLKDALNKGAVWWRHKGKTLRLRRATQLLDKGTLLQLFYDPEILSRAVEAPQLIDSKRSYSVWYKPHGVLSQGSQWGDHCSLLRFAELQPPRRPCYLVHRLDADAAGLIVIAHTPHAAAHLSALFQNGHLDKQYQARVEGLFPLSPQEVIFDQPLDGKSATTRAAGVNHDPSGATSLLQIKIETGRKHQIRRHLSIAGFPIAGDRLYGSRHPGELQLLAWRLAFQCPENGSPRVYQLPDSLQFFVARDDLFPSGDK